MQICLRQFSAGNPLQKDFSRLFLTVCYSSIICCFSVHNASHFRLTYLTAKEPVSWRKTVHPTLTMKSSSEKDDWDNFLLWFLELLVFLFSKTKFIASIRLCSHSSTGLLLRRWSPRPALPSKQQPSSCSLWLSSIIWKDFAVSALSVAEIGVNLQSQAQEELHYSSDPEPGPSLSSKAWP